MPRVTMGTMNRRRDLVLAAAFFAACCAAPAANVSQLSTPNVVVITPRLFTSGQPPGTTLATLGSQGFQAVINLAPPTAHDAARDEAVIVGRQGLVFANIPIAFDGPTEQDYDAFAAVPAGLRERKALVQRQVNTRASSLVFLYRVIALKEDPDHAYEAVTKGFPTALGNGSSSPCFASTA